MTRITTRFVVSAVLVVTVGLGGSAQAQSSNDPDAGRDVFEANCAMCHGADASGMMGMHPSLRGAVERLSLEGVEITIRNGRDTNPPMPAFENRLSDKEIADVVAYLDTLPVGPRNFDPGGDGMMGGDMDGMMGDGGWSWVAWMALFLVVLAAVVIASIFVIRGMQARGRQARDSQSGALDILKERYARGEIDRQEYEERRRALSD